MRTTIVVVAQVAALLLPIGCAAPEKYSGWFRIRAILAASRSLYRRCVIPRSRRSAAIAGAEDDSSASSRR